MGINVRNFVTIQQVCAVTKYYVDPEGLVDDMDTIYGRIKRCGVWCAAIIMLLLFFPTLKLHAQEDKIRVGYFLMPGYQEITEGGTRWGFGYDYLQEIAKYTGWKYEFVVAPWDECLDMLGAGEVDIVTYAEKVSDRMGNFEFSSYPMGMSSSVLTVLPDDDKYYYNDFSRFEGMKIGVVEGSGADKDVEEFFSSIAVSVSIESFDTEHDVKEALQAGIIDAIGASNHRRVDNEKIIATFDVTPFYGITKKGNVKLISEFNRAMEEMMLSSPYFERELYSKYFEQNASYSIALTRKEKNYVDNHKTLRLAVSPDANAMCYYNGTEFTGIVLDSVKAIAGKVGLEVEYVETDSYKESLEQLWAGEVDLVGDFYSNHSWSEKNDFLITEPYMEVQYIEIRRRERSRPPEKTRVATCENFFFNTEYILKHYPEENLVYFDREEDCVKAVQMGTADVAFINQYTAKVLLKKDENLRLDTFTLFDTDHGLSIALQKDNKVLRSMLNKGISSLGTTNIKRIVEFHTQKINEEVSLMSYVYYNPVEFILILGILFCTAMVILIYVVLSKKRYNQHIYELAFQDTLTGIGNIHFFEEFVDKRFGECREKEIFIISLDISHFSAINETYGRHVGDYTIRYVGQRLKELYGKEGIVARSKVDNFLVFGVIDGDTKAEEWVETIKEEIGKFVYEEKGIRRNEIYLNYDFGIVIEWCTKETSAKILIDHAEMARKVAKRGAHLCYFNEDMEQQIIRENVITDSMVHALKTGEFQVYYQPKYRMDNDEIVGAEALVRWFSKDYGFMNPGEFISIFENNGFIVELDFYVMEQVYRMLRERIECGEKVVQVSINQSRLHFAQNDYIERLDELRSRYEIPMNLVELELTESILANIQDISIMVDKLKANGYYLSLDDFGSGYSSLNMLKEVPINTLKIDKDFLSGGDKEGRSQKVIRKVVELADELGMDVVCEGVEEKEQVEFLKSIGCMYAQGYYYAKPMPEDDFRKLLDNRF